MKTPEPIQKFSAWVFIILFWLVAGVFISPCWLIVTIAGGLLGAYKWEEAPRVFWDLVTIKWFTER